MISEKVIAGALIGYGAYLLLNQEAEAAAPDYVAETGSTGGNVLQSVTESTLEILDKITMGTFSLSNIKKAKREMLSLPNVKAMLATIRAGEGTADANGYRRIFGGQLFTGYKDHPRVTVKKGGYTSTAAGAYQILAGVWDETAKILGLADFTPANQDLAALGRIAARGALDDVLAGRFDAAIAKLNREWASLPGSPYGQPTKTLGQAKAVYLAQGGTIETA